MGCCFDFDLVLHDQALLDQIGVVIPAVAVKPEYGSPPFLVIPKHPSGQSNFRARQRMVRQLLGRDRWLGIACAIVSVHVAAHFGFAIAPSRPSDGQTGHHPPRQCVSAQCLRIVFFDWHRPSLLAIGRPIVQVGKTDTTLSDNAAQCKEKMMKKPVNSGPGNLARCVCFDDGLDGQDQLRNPGIGPFFQFPLRSKKGTHSGC